jgi:hypothetical protein
MRTLRTRLTPSSAPRDPRWTRKVPLRPAQKSLGRFEGIHKSLDRVRSTSRTVTVDRQALANLLIDHGKVGQDFRIHVGR